MDGRAVREAVRDKCFLTCRDFINDELPDMADHYLARYLAALIEGDMSDTVRAMRGGYRVSEEAGPHQCVRVLTSQGREHSMVMLCSNLSRERVAEAVERLRRSKAEERVLVYLFSFGNVADEETIAQAIMEAELLGLVRDTGIVAYFAMLDPRAGMGMLARIDGNMRSIEYLPH